MIRMNLAMHHIEFQLLLPYIAVESSDRICQNASTFTDDTLSSTESHLEDPAPRRSRPWVAIKALEVGSRAFRKKGLEGYGPGLAIEVPFQWMRSWHFKHFNPTFIAFQMLADASLLLLHGGRWSPTEYHTMRPAAER